MLLVKYQTPIIENELILDSNNVLKFKELILDLNITKVNKDENNEKMERKQKEIEDICSKNNNPPYLTQLNFVQDVVLAENIVIYRKLEIKKQIMIINYIIHSYKLACFQVLKYKSKNANNLNTIEFYTLLKNKNQIKQYLTKILEKEEIFDLLRKTLCRYNDLEKNLELLLKKKL
jgi:hypothetical protein